MRKPGGLNPPNQGTRTTPLSATSEAHAGLAIR